MRRVRCYECGRSYNYDEDGFCPRCGAFNQPGKSTSVDADGTVVRVDGLNERGHRNSFVHAELHEENRERRGSGLSKDGKSSAAAVHMSAPPARKQQDGRTRKSPLAVVVWIIMAIIFLNVLSSFLVIFF